MRATCLRAALTGALLVGSIHARAQMFGAQTKLDPSFCRSRNIRETVVYVDDSMLVSGQDEWFRKLYSKLAATLVPGERTTLVELSPLTGQSTERWSGCWPAYTRAERDKLAGQMHLFSADPLETIKEQQGLFARGIGVALRQIENAHPRTAQQAAVNVEDPPRKSILRALASDESRYANSQATIRAIMYSDLVENSDLGLSLKPVAGMPVNCGARLGTYLRRSVFYIFGAGVNNEQGGAEQDAIRAFWNEALHSMAANVAGIGSDLTVPNEVPTSAKNYDLLLKDGTQTLVGRLALLVDDDGVLVDSWLGIVRLRTAAISGTYKCIGSGPDTACSLQATTLGGVVTMSPTETISMTGSGDDGSLTGKIGVPGSAVNLPIAASVAND